MLLARRLAAARSVKAAAGVHSRGSRGAPRGSSTAARGSGAGGRTEALRASGTRASGAAGPVRAGRAGGSEGIGSGATAVARSSTLGSSGTGGVVRNGSVDMRPPRPLRASPRPPRASPRAASDNDGKAFDSGAGEATGALDLRAGTAEPTRYGRPKKISKNVGAKAAVAMANPRNGRPRLGRPESYSRYPGSSRSPTGKTPLPGSPSPSPR